jgi:hypothetical protein
MLWAYPILADILTRTQSNTTYGAPFVVERGIADGTRYRRALLAIRVWGMLGSKAALSLKALRRY